MSQSCPHHRWSNIPGSEGGISRRMLIRSLQFANQMLMHKVVPTKSMMVKGPEGVTGSFIVCATDIGAVAYWEALDFLLKTTQQQGHVANVN
jgi:hypothetical protein